MKERFIGEVIKKRRTELGLSQEQICEGICEPMTISRLENGKQTPSRNVVRALCQRLGLPDDRFFAVLTDKEIKIDKLYKDICACNVEFERSIIENRKEIRERGMKKIAELESIIQKKDYLMNQFILRSKMILDRDEKPYSLEESLEILKQVIKISQPRFDENSIATGIYSIEEMKLINQLAMTYSEMGNSKSALNIWYGLNENIENRYDSITKSKRMHSLILFGLARELLITGKYQKASEYAKKGIEISISRGIYQQLPGYKIILAECAYKNQMIKECRSQLIECYYLCKAINDPCDLQVVISNYKEYFGEIIDENN